MNSIWGENQITFLVCSTKKGNYIFSVSADNKTLREMYIKQPWIDHSYTTIRRESSCKISIK